MYGAKPKCLGVRDVQLDELMFYQYLPVKFPNTHTLHIEDRLSGMSELLGEVSCDFIGEYGLDRFNSSYIYVTAKKMYQPPRTSFNRLGWHSDGFMTEDINYVWSDCIPTVFSSSTFTLTQDDSLSLVEMENQAYDSDNFEYPPKTLLRLDQYNIHKVGLSNKLELRTFIKVSFSKDKYDLLGNSLNHKLPHNWKMRSRNVIRNIPQKIDHEK